MIKKRITLIGELEYSIESCTCRIFHSFCRKHPFKADSTLHPFTL